MRNIADTVIDKIMTSHRVVVVLSAMGKITKIAMTKTITSSPNKRELDAFLTMGE